MENKTLNVTNLKDTKSKIADVQVFGNVDAFVLLCKASSESQGWMKSTKVCNVAGGCIVQVSTQQKNPDGSYSVAEALSYVPNVQIDKDSEPRQLVPVGTDVIKEKKDNLCKTLMLAMISGDDESYISSIIEEYKKS